MSEDFYDNMLLPVQIDLLAKYIMENIPGEPSQSESAVECAIRLMKSYRAELSASRAENKALREIFKDFFMKAQRIFGQPADEAKAEAALDAALKAKE